MTTRVLYELWAASAISVGGQLTMNGQHSSGVTYITTITLRTMGMTAISFNKPLMYVILGGTGVVVLIFSVMIVFAIKRRCLRRRVDIEIESLSPAEFDAVVMREFKND
uniref:Uncharacterized protein n=1 Tax=Magallana gigas TaxID=29159 RepID=A0A8W8MCW6_MAGGI